MAGTFRIFSESENICPLTNEQSNKVASLKTKSMQNIGSIEGNGQSTQFKPKGLSVRSKSDLNVYVSSNAKSKNTKENIISKKQESKSTLPNKFKTLKDKVTNLLTKEPLPKMQSKQNLDEFVFAKPAVPVQLNMMKKSFEPEKLSFEYNQEKFMIEEIELEFQKDLDWVKSARLLNKSEDDILPIDDEGFISGGDSFESFETTPEIARLSLSDVELPELSDLDDSMTLV